MGLLIVRREHVITEVAARAPQHGVRVVAVVGGVVFDQQVIALYPVVVPGARRKRSLPGEVQVCAGRAGRFARRELGRKPVEVKRDDLVQHGSRTGSEPGGRKAERLPFPPSAGGRAGGGGGGGAGA